MSGSATETYLVEYQINIVSKELQNSLIYVGPEQEKIIYIYHQDNHYDVITGMPGFSTQVILSLLQKGLR